MRERSFSLLLSSTLTFSFACDGGDKKTDTAAPSEPAAAAASAEAGASAASGEPAANPDAKAGAKAEASDKTPLARVMTYLDPDAGAVLVLTRVDKFDFDPEDWGAAKANPSPRTNTTIACIATDAALTPSQAQRLADMAVAGMARAIRPVFAPFDGDVVFALSTGRKPLSDPPAFTLARLGELAAGTLARAIARGVYEANKAPLVS